MLFFFKEIFPGKNLTKFPLCFRQTPQKSNIDLIVIQNDHVGEKERIPTLPSGCPLSVDKLIFYLSPDVSESKHD